MSGLNFNMTSECWIYCTVHINQKWPQTLLFVHNKKIKKKKNWSWKQVQICLYWKDRVGRVSLLATLGFYVNAFAMSQWSHIICDNDSYSCHLVPMVRRETNEKKFIFNRQYAEDKKSCFWFHTLLMCFWETLLVSIKLQTHRAGMALGHEWKPKIKRQISIITQKFLLTAYNVKWYPQRCSTKFSTGVGLKQSLSRATKTARDKRTKLRQRSILSYSGCPATAGGFQMITTVMNFDQQVAVIERLNNV